MLKYPKICSFFGHRIINVTEELREKIKEVVIDLISNKGVEIFYFGGEGYFDDLCHQVVSSLISRFPYIKRIFCLTDSKYLNYNKRPKWLKNEDYEDFIYLNLKFDWWYKRIYFRNLEMVNESDYIIFFVEPKEESGAYKTYKYACKIKKNIINLFY